jgi:hypothetical protein
MFLVIHPFYYLVTILHGKSSPEQVVCFQVIFHRTVIWLIVFKSFKKYLVPSKNMATRAISIW